MFVTLKTITQTEYCFFFWEPQHVAVSLHPGSVSLTERKVEAPQKAASKAV